VTHALYPSGILTRLVAGIMPLAQDEWAALAELEHPVAALGRGQDIVRAGAPYTAMHVLQDGWAIQSKLLEDGRCQIIDFLLPGDLICHEAVWLARCDYSVTALTPVRLSSFGPLCLSRIAAAHPRLHRALEQLRARVNARMIERLVSLGRRPAPERVAHLLVELCYRMEAAGLARGDVVEMPITQDQLADCVGISLVHANRVLQQLRREGLLLSHPHGKVSIADIEGLKQAACFDDAYLHPEPRPDGDRNGAALAFTGLGLGR
jgi:CRP-like cAMP-binding protein